MVKQFFQIHTNLQPYREISNNHHLEFGSHHMQLELSLSCTEVAYSLVEEFHNFSFATAIIAVIIAVKYFIYLILLSLDLNYFPLEVTNYSFSVIIIIINIKEFRLVIVTILILKETSQVVLVKDFVEIIPT